MIKVGIAVVNITWADRHHPLAGSKHRKVWDKMLLRFPPKRFYFNLCSVSFSSHFLCLQQLLNYNITPSNFICGWWNAFKGTGYAAVYAAVYEEPSVENLSDVVKCRFQEVRIEVISSISTLLRLRHSKTRNCGTFHYATKRQRQYEFLNFNFSQQIDFNNILFCFFIQLLGLRSVYSYLHVFTSNWS